ncbi:MAG: alanine--tRNA ligase [Acidobacteriota bacterium]|nr:alanine--tRNA ligase [Acidobacteriota bacterium]
MRSQDIRGAFLEFFAARGHKIVPSSPLIPRDDPTLLFTNAGMNQFKDVFLGRETRSYTRAVSVQKCMRVSGKHNDLETVGRTPKHHTFFEMLGNFSFGDYFKAEAVAFAWELMTRVFSLPEDRLYITIYTDDDDAYRIWSEDIGIPEDRIFRYGKKDNFWAMGDTGPCGPCSEIHYDFGAALEPGDPYSLIETGSDRFSELWNLVFMEFFQDEAGGLQPLPSPSIDTGMGLERMAAVLQGRQSNYDSDLFFPLIEDVCRSAGREYPADDAGDVSVRIIADHVRAAAFLIGDGAVPANEGRGYVLRRLIRRAYRHGNLIGLDKPFLYEIVGRVGDIMKSAYPELTASLPLISRVCLSEEERFAATLTSGLRQFGDYFENAKDPDNRVLPGTKVFKLYDTFGFPLDLTRELAAEKGWSVDEEGFQRELETQRSRAREAWKGGEKQKRKALPGGIEGIRVRSVVHEAREVLETSIAAVLHDGRSVRQLKEGETGDVILEETPFYAEAGGQVGDTGLLKGLHFSASVDDTRYLTPDIIAHRVRVLSGSLTKGDAVEAAIDAGRRAAVSRNHTATHLLHAALRQVLGQHVKQSGSRVGPDRLRFDFTHYAALTPEEIREVESRVNAVIRENMAVGTRTTTMEEGLREGAMAIFEEKYGDEVRLVGVGDFSRELCGGVHVPASGHIGLFKILSESGIAAGMRRIEAVTGEEALGHIRDLEDMIGRLERILAVGRRDLPSRLEKIKDALDEKEKEIRMLRRKLLSGSSPESAAQVRTVKGVPLLARKVENIPPGDMRDLADSLKQKMGRGVVVLGAADGNKTHLVVSVTADLTERIRADSLVKALSAVLGGGGGGRADFAQAGGTHPEKLGAVLEDDLPRILEQMV